MALVPIEGGGGLVRDTATGNIFTPGGGFGGPHIAQQAVERAPLPEPPIPPEPYGPPQPASEQAAAAKSVPAREPPQPAPRQENPEVDGGELWLRKWKLTIGTQSGTDALDLSALAFTFQVDQAQFLVAPSAVITVFNVGENILSLMQKEFTHVVLEAGYRSTQYGRLFGGPIAYFQHGRVDATDTFIEIHAIQYDQALSGALINTWLDTGHTKRDVVNACIAAMGAYGVTPGQITFLGDEKSPRGRTLYGNPADVLRDVAHTADAQVFVDQDGKLHLLGKDEALAMQNDTVPILNSKTGLVGVPTQTLGQGVNARSLLNPAIRPGGQVKINQKDIAQPTIVNEAAMTDPQGPFRLEMSKMSIAADGYYVVVSVQHNGESRGNSWYSDLKTMPFDISKVEVGLGRM